MGSRASRVDEAHRHSQCQGSVNLGGACFLRELPVLRRSFTTTEFATHTRSRSQLVDLSLLTTDSVIALGGLERVYS